MKEQNKNLIFRTRVCKRCLEIFYTAYKTSKICPNCGVKSKKLIRNKFMPEEIKNKELKKMYPIAK